MRTITRILIGIAIFFAFLYSSCTGPKESTKSAIAFKSEYRYELTSLTKAEALAASDYKGKKLELKVVYNQIYHNAYWANVFPASKWIQFWVVDENDPNHVFQNVFVIKTDANVLFESKKGTLLILRGTMDHNRFTPFFIVDSIMLVQ